MYRCDECNVDFNNHQQRANHIRWIHKKVKFSDAGLKNIAIANKKTADKKYGGKYIEESIDCPKCGTSFSRSYKEETPH